MLDLDHIAITVKDLDESIAFYKMFGYELLERFSDDGYNWVILRLNNHSLELFQLTSDKEKPIDHIAYNYDSDEEVLELMKRLGYKKEDIYKESISEYELILTFEAYYNVDYHEGYTSNDRDVEPEREYLEYKDFEIYNIKLINKNDNSISITDEEIGDYIYDKFEASSYHDEFIQYAIEDDIDPYREDYYDRG